MATWRIRYVSDGGPVSADNPRGWPAHRSFPTLLGAMKALRDAVNSDPRVGTELGVALQFRLCAGAPWHWISSSETDRYARELNLRNWRPLQVSP